MTRKKVALIGWDPEAFFKYNAWPGLTQEMLASQIGADIAALAALGHDVRPLYIFSADTAHAAVVKALHEEAFDVVLIGAGVRKVDANFLLFEAVVNAVHAGAPKAKICFNTNPSDTADAVKRWIEQP